MSLSCLVGSNARSQMKNGKSHVVPENYDSKSLPSLVDSIEDSKWDNLPGELLLDIIRRVEGGHTSWPARRDIVACASVCRSWRITVKQIVKTTEQSGLITFPMSLKQPGPRSDPIQCFIRRDRASSVFRLYLGLSPALAGDASKLLLAAKKVRKATGTEFSFSLTPDGFSKSSVTYVGKLSSNFLGTKFAIHDTDPIPPKFNLKKVPQTVKSKVGTISYELNVLRTKGPRRMNCTMHSIPISAVETGGTAPTPATFSGETGKNPVVGIERKDVLVLRNKAPRWHEQLQCWCLNFKGRVTVASVKNFQLAVGGGGGGVEQDDVVLQFGKIGKDIFTMDYGYPLSAFQAFAICLSSFDTKPACE